MVPRPGSKFYSGFEEVQIYGVLQHMYSVYLHMRDFMVCSKEILRPAFDSVRNFLGGRRQESPGIHQHHQRRPWN